MIKRSLFNISHKKLLSCNMGELVPLTIMDVTAGDVFRHDTSLLIRTQPLLAPIMHKVDASIHHFFVPIRLIWDDFGDFLSGGSDGLQAPTPPTVDLSWSAGSPPTGTGVIGGLADYLGCPTGIDGLTVSALPFRAYDLIVNNFYLDTQLDTPLTISTASGADTTTSLTLQNGRWNKDYFTSARPSPQLGNEVSIPLVGDAPVSGIGKFNQNYGSTSQAVYETDGTSTTTYADAQSIDSNDDNTFYVEEDPNNSGYPNIRADLEGVSGVQIEDLRLSSALQRWKEKMNNFGTRFPEFLHSVFGVKPQDQRLQIPEYVGGGSGTIQFSEIPQTAEGTAPVGELRGHGINTTRSNRYKYHAQEPGFIISLLCVRPKTVYTQGLNKLWSRTTKYDYLLPDFSHLGDQEVLNKEVYASHTTPDGIFGYVPRYDDFRFIPNSVAGEFRDTLDFWHMARIFASDPALNSDFVKCNPTDRVYATDADQLQINAIHNVRVKRLLPKYSNPRLL